jgi:hypothetical protein
MLWGHPRVRGKQDDLQRCPDRPLLWTRVNPYTRFDLEMDKHLDLDV